MRFLIDAVFCSKAAMLPAQPEIYLLKARNTAVSQAQMYRWFPSIMKVLTIIEPETLVRWHRAGFRRYWRWKSRSRGETRKST
jgi:hypothetical protein